MRDELSGQVDRGSEQGPEGSAGQASVLRFFTELTGNIRYSLRTMRKAPLTTTIALLSLALGIGVNMSSFISVNALILNPFPYPNLARIVTLWETVRQQNPKGDGVSPGNLTDWKQASRSFDDLAAYRNWDATLTGEGEPERIQAALVSPEFFRVLSLPPESGRTFTQEEGEAGGDIPVVISRGFWKTKLPSLANPVGTLISLGQEKYTVVGVMPEAFDFPLGCELWAPLRLTGTEKISRVSHSLAVIGRLKKDVSVAQARAEMGLIARRLEQQYPTTNEASAVLVTPLTDLTSKETGRFTLVLMGATLFVLLLACTNVSNLYLARINSKRKEFALRISLGASRARVARQVVTEGIVGGTIAGSLGLLLAYWNLGVTKASFPSQIMHWVAGLKNMRIDGATIGFAISLSVVAGALCSIPAVIQLLRSEDDAALAENLKEGGRSSIGMPSGNRMRNALIATEVALALLLVVGAGLMVSTFRRLMAIDPGFDPTNVLMAEVSLSTTSYRSPDQLTGFVDRVLKGLSSVKQVKAAAVSSDLGTPTTVALEDRGTLRAEEPKPAVAAVTAHYLDALRLPILQGRGLSESDVADRPRVVVISQSVAQRYWRDSQVVGRKIRLQMRSGDSGDNRSRSDDTWLTVVGVCKDSRNWFFGTPIPAAYVSYLQYPRGTIQITLKALDNTALVTNDLRSQVGAVDRTQALYNVKALEDVLAEKSSGVRISARMMTTYACIAFILALTGIYSIASFFVAQRRQEIGVRMALGATPSNILRMTMTQSGRMAFTGLAVGLCCSIVLTKVMSHALYNIVSLDVFTILCLTMAMALAALLAGFVPARRAARVDPVVALRQ